MESNAAIITDEVVISKIYIIRNTKVMLDKDLAELYQVTTGNLNKSVFRNKTRFPEDFMFQLYEEEFKNLIFQNGISSWGGTRKLPYAFTEQGVAMLSGVLRSERAIQVNIRIMRIFTRIKHILNNHSDLNLEIEKIKKKLNNHDKNLEIVFNYLDELIGKQTDPKHLPEIGFVVGKG
ncbi:ORF6N domain-containing protein [Daejeonella sp. H1SJ63]|jgi:hypothetical protein|uniref:ORF6N domain-containing protein n=1 Tax=Daejeonella sp. H1SJ63 TaxID=3034145 RepID=UPI0023EC34B5|nr:ORF6N domain-containing protein [Daejeonella sp. H1SJ63]